MRSPHQAASVRADRRRFLKGAAMAAVAGLAPGAGLAAGAELDSEAIKGFAARLRGRVVAPTDGEYDRARRVVFWNPGTDRKPALIAKCRSAEDVARSIEFAQRHQLAVAVRSGGHSFLGWGTCDRGLLIDMSGMSGLTIDPAKRTGRAQGGVLTGPFVAAAGRHGLAPICGECATVGVSGLTLGGGLGWLSGKYGAACDNVLSARLVTADSRTIGTDASREPDLYWAIRGGGGNFGIATEIEFQLHPVREALAGEIVYRFEDARRVMRFYSEFMTAAPDEFHVELTLAGRTGVSVGVCHAGDRAQGEGLLRAWRALAPAVRDTVRLGLFANLHRAPEGGSWRDAAFSLSKGVYLPQLSDEVFETVLERMSQAPEGAAIGFGHYMHGAVCRVPADATAYELRAPGAVSMRVNARWQDAAASERNMEWADRTEALLRRHSNGRIYANFQSVEGPETGRGVFGRNYERLAGIKAKYDPANFFRRNPNVAGRG